jgi:anhydro-N-acetylmuramic acid kinase
LKQELFIGLMSGTSLDGVDAVVIDFKGHQCQVLHTASLAYPDSIRSELLALHAASHNELERTALIANRLSTLYADCIKQLLSNAALSASQIKAIGCHGQTIRHRPELGFTLQIVNPALLAELTGIDVVSDFRSRDIAAGGQGAPLVPAFHQAVFGSANKNRVVINIGGIANLTSINANGHVIGFDSGPGNMLMDAWTEEHLGERYDHDGQWAASGQVIAQLLARLLAHPYFKQTPPKSTGRDLFSLAWLADYLTPDYAAADVQRTLLELTAQSISMALTDFCGEVDEIYLCGGGALNSALVARLQQLQSPVKIHLSDTLGIGVQWVEAAAFGWLAKQCISRQAANLPGVTGAKGTRILGAIYAS